MHVKGDNNPHKGLYVTVSLIFNVTFALFMSKTSWRVIKRKAEPVRAPPTGVEVGEILFGRSKSEEPKKRQML